MNRLLALMLCLLLVLPVPAARAEEELTIVHVTDMHYLSPTLTDYGERFMALIESADGKLTHYTPQLMAAFVAEMRLLQPDAIILSGDLTFNGAPQSHAGLIALLTPLAQEGVQVLALPGNHDTNTTAFRFEGDQVYSASGLSDGTFRTAYAALGYSDALSRDKASMSYLAQIRPDVWCLMLDVNANGAPGLVRDETLAWVEAQLIRARAEGAAVIAVSHQPALIHNRLFTSGYVIHNHARLHSLYRQYQVQLNLCGHLHMQHMAESDGLLEIAGSSLAVAPNQYGVLRLQGNQLLDYRTRPLDISAWARQSGQTNPDLLDFTAFASGFFDQTTRSQTAAMLASGSITPEEQSAMTDFAVRLNAEYFSGRRTLTADHPAWALWQKHLPGSFFTLYMGSILEEPPRDMTRHSFARGTP